MSRPGNWCHNFRIVRRDKSKTTKKTFFTISFFIDQQIERISVSFKMCERSFTQYCAPSLVSHPLVWAQPVVFTLHLIVLIEARTSPALFLVPIYREKNAVLIADIGRLSALDVLTIVSRIQVSANELRLTGICNFAPHNKQLYSRGLLLYSNILYFTSDSRASQWLKAPSNLPTEKIENIKTGTNFCIN